MNATSRHAAPLRLEVLPQPALQLAVSFLALLAAASLLAAGVAHQLVSAWHSVWVLPLCAALGWRVARVRPRLLLWDGQSWRLHEREASGAPRDPGVELRLAAVFDFDDWLLLRAPRVDAAAPRLQRLRWHWVPLYLPLSRRRQPGVWGTLRATLFAARASLDGQGTRGARDQPPGGAGPAT